LKPQLDGFLSDFRNCFSYEGTRDHFPVYIRGLLSDLPRKSVEPIALNAEVPPRTLQEFLSLLKWDDDRMRDLTEQRVAKQHSSSHAIGIVDETGCPKKGDRTPGVQRQWCGRTGKVDNCVVTVHLAYAADDFRCLLDSELFLPESWSEDQERRKRAKIPESMTYRPKWQIALDLIKIAEGNGVDFKWFTFDEGYGGKPGFLKGLEGRKYVGEVPKNIRGWLEPPRTTERPYQHSKHGRPKKTPRVRSGEPKSKTLELHLQNSPELCEQPWERYYIKDTSLGPFVWEAKRVLFYPAEAGLPAGPLVAIFARNVLNPNEIKYFLSNALDAPTEILLLVGFSRWPVERCFEDEKSELGLHHFEGRTYRSLIRHQRLCAAAHLFLSEAREGLKKKKSEPDGRPDKNGFERFGSLLVIERA
jgi:SRSO17 transposase